MAGFKVPEHFLPKCFRSPIERTAKAGWIIIIVFHFFLIPVNGTNKKTDKQ